MKRVLLCSVIKPFGPDSPYEAPGNLYEIGIFHRSFTRRQGAFSMLQQQHTYALHLIAHNLQADCTVLDYPDEARLVAELSLGWDVVAIGCVVSTLFKARRMVELVRAHCPGATTVVGGPGSLGVGELIEPFSDHLCTGEGVAFMRELLGEPNRPIDFPVMRLHHSNQGLLGLPLKDHNFPVVVGLGCPRRCGFCATSAQFGGEHQPLFESGEELFAFMQRTEREVEASGERFSFLYFMVYDENFMLQRDFVEQFRRCNKEQALRDRQYLLFTFGDARALDSYSTEALLEIGIDTIWVGIESPSSRTFDKQSDVDLAGLVRRLSGAGIKVIGSLIAGLESHDEAAIRADMEFALSLPTVAVQYMPVNPLPGTAWYAELKERGLLPDRDARWFNMSHYNVAHPSLDEPTVLALLEEYFEREHDEAGPMVYRFLRTRLRGWQALKDHASPYVRARTRVYEIDLLRGFPVLLLGERLGPTPAVRERFTDLRRAVQRAFPRLRTLARTARGQLAPDEGGVFALLSTPGIRTLMREALVANAVLRDPRTPGPRDWLLRRRATEARARSGVLPWDQPQTVMTRYPGGAA